MFRGGGVLEAAAWPGAELWAVRPDAQAVAARLRNTLAEREAARDRSPASQAAAACRITTAAMRQLDQVTDLSLLLDNAASLACGVGRFDAVLISTVDAKAWRPTAVATTAGGCAQARSLTGAVLRLSPDSPEAEVARRDIARLGEWGRPDDVVRHAPRLPRRTYAVVPLTVGIRVIGLVHGVAPAGERADLMAAESLHRFARALSLVYERAALRMRIAEQRVAINEALSHAAATGQRRIPPPVPRGAYVAASREGEISPTRLEQAARKLTPRQIDVLRLMVLGATNVQIAQELGITPTTVKHHARGIYRGLRVTSRAAATAFCFETRLPAE